MSRPDPVSLRLTPELRARLDVASKEAGRSLNGEIKMRLEWSFAQENQRPAFDAGGDLEKRVSVIEQAALSLAMNDKWEEIEQRLAALESKAK